MLQNIKTIPLHSLVILVGPSHAGKTKFAEENFPHYEIVSAEKIKVELCGDPERHDINREVFEEIKNRTRAKLSIGERAVIDSNNLKRWERTKIAWIGKDFGVPVFYVIINRPLEEKKKQATDNIWYIEKQDDIFRRNEKEILRGDGLAEVIPSQSKINVISKLPAGDLYNELTDRGFKGITVVPDVHGTLESLKSAVLWAQAGGRFILFLGDIIDYGPKPLECVDLVYDLVVRGQALMLIGNHENKIIRWMEQQQTGNVKLHLSEGNQVTIDALESLDEQSRKKWLLKFKALISLSRYHVQLQNMMFAHAAIDSEFWDFDKLMLTGKQKTRAMFGEIDKDKPFVDKYPNRTYNWVDEIPQGKTVIVGHDIRSTDHPYTQEGKLGGKAIFLDTGSGKGGVLSTADIKFENKSARITNFKQP